jgi:hypothetical protein
VERMRCLTVGGFLQACNVKNLGREDTYSGILGRLPGLGIFVIYFSGGVRTQHGVQIKVYNRNGFRRRINKVLFVPERDCVLMQQIQCEFDAVAPTFLQFFKRNLNKYSIS